MEDPLELSPTNLILAGILDVDSSDKASRFIRFCDAFNIPLVSLMDAPGFMPGIEQEQKESLGMVRKCSMLGQKLPFQNHSRN